MDKFDDQLLIESAPEGKLTHLTHAEDRVIDDGEAGFNHSLLTLNAVHNALTGKKNTAHITTKYDGSPSIVFGHNPDNGKFFVASKSAFNKTPKINYSHKDIDYNHGHAPGLADKLKQALEHLPKVAPKQGVFQGDLMYGKGDVSKKGGHVSFQPNTIRYSTPDHSDEGKKIAKSKLGVVVHTEYQGKNLADMSASFKPDHSKFGKHDDVHVMTPEATLNKNHYSKPDQDAYMAHMQHAVKHMNQIPSKAHSAMNGMKDKLNMYINKTVREDAPPSVEGFSSFVKDRHTKEAEGMKTAKGKEGKMANMQAELNNIASNKNHFHHMFAVHHHVQQAKNLLVNALSKSTKFEHSIDGKEAKPEGFVVTYKGKPTKLVDRAEFSRANLLNGQMMKAKGK